MSEIDAITDAAHRMAKRLGMVFVLDPKKLAAFPFPQSPQPQQQ